ncbi:FmdE family protein [Desulfonema magnum]|uniref:Formylmethanofuran dehydrogenase subunit E domain-containing protein n=1 Tax=Desulfonema magnum TaxID=45655 RepID=A0A975GQK4_9BACT|nr:FmdE family protein [Desulfonema magnum]QTA89038.1 Formylmethanofuran dehydrogenase subunit E domain-containing protein [Desulfonema magnum]
MESRQILEETLKFHGHICWASAIGARIGIVALRELGVERTGISEELHCIVEIGDNHGAQCFADGVQCATGCTFGKANIEKAGWGKLAITLIDKKKEQAVRVSYKPGRHKMVAESSFMKKRAAGISPDQIPQKEAWEMVNMLWEAPESEVLTVGEVVSYPYEDFGEVMGLMPCESCGEMVSKAYLRVVGDKHMCIPCSGYDR